MNTIGKKYLYIALAVVGIVAAFWGGSVYANYTASRLATDTHPPIAPSPLPSPVPTTSAVSVVGKVVAVASGTILVEDVLGKQQTVSFTDSTLVSTTKVVKESISDIHTGDQIVIVGEKDTSGKITAKSIQTPSIPAPNMIAPSSPQPPPVQKVQ